jgi:hypothetical protein
MSDVFNKAGKSALKPRIAAMPLRGPRRRLALMQVGRYGLLEGPCGTNGLSPCVGLIVRMRFATAPYFVAHISCGVQVPDGNNPNYGIVRTDVRDRLRRVLPHASARGQVHIATGSTRDPSAQAIIAGILDWTGFPVQVLPQDSIVIDEGGALSTAGNHPNNESGTGPFVTPSPQMQF